MCMKLESRVYGLQGCFCEIDRWIWGLGLWMWVKLGFSVWMHAPGFCVKVYCIECIMGLNLLM